MQNPVTGRKRTTSYCLSKLKEEKFHNWIKAQLALFYTKEGVKSIVIDKTTSCHQAILNAILTKDQIKNRRFCNSCCLQNVLVCPTEGVCSVPGSCRFHQSEKYRYCPNNVCDLFRDNIRKKHVNESPSWKNTSPDKWCKDPWEMVKCFMPSHGYANANTFEDTDFHGILNVMLNHRDILECVLKDMCAEVRQMSNKIGHSPEQNIETTELHGYIDKLVQFLSQTCFQKDAISVRAVTKLTELKDNNLSISSSEVVQSIPQEHEIVRHIREILESIDEKYSKDVGVILAPVGERVASKSKLKDYTQLEEGLPPEILRKDKRSIELYKQALAEGSVPDYSIRVMIVGHSNVGKTTLKRRLFDETVDIKKRKCTNGIEVHVGRCKVNIKSGEWIVQEKDGRLETLSQRLCELLSRNRPPSKPHNHTKERERDEKKSSNSPSNDSSSSSTPPSPNGSAAEFLEPPGTKETNDAMDISSMDDEEACLSDLKEILEQSSKIETIQHTSELSIWDFAGQSDYYAMHQVFLSRRAVYLLVTKLTEHISDTVDVQRLVDSTGRNYFKISDLIHFWLNSIYEHVGKEDSYDPTRHNVILVGTHADQITENSEDNSGSDFFDTVRMNLHDQVTFDLLTELDFRVNNTIDPTDPSSTISDLRKYIIETASKQSYWGKLIPAKWCNLEKILLKLQNQGSKILKLSDVMELNKILPVALRSDEIELFLQVHHERGNILYYGKDHQLNEYIILEPQWLIDAFKSIVTSRSFCCKKKNIAKMYREFEQTAVLQKQLIDSIWEQENYSEFKHHSVLILCFMEKLGLIAKPYLAAMPESTLRTAEYFVPYFLTKRVPVEILKAEGNKVNYTSKLCITTKSGFFPNTIFNKLLAACIQSFKISGPPETKHIYCGCGVFDVGTSCHQMFVCFADNVIHIWLSSLSTHEDQNYSECKMICDFIMKVLRKDLNEVVTFYKCWKSSVESKFKLLKEDLLGNNEVICYCQNDGHPVKAWEITKYWETGSYKEDTPGSSDSSKTMSGYPLRKIHDDTLSESCVNALSEKMKSVGALITSKGLGTVFRVGTKYVMTAYHVVQPLVKIDFETNHVNASALKNNSVFVNFNESLLDHEDRIYRLTDNIFFDVELDFAILEISNPDHLLPASLQLCFDAFEIRHLKEVSLIGYGHPNELGKHLDPRCKILSPNDEQIQTAMTWFNQNSSFLKSKQHGIAELVEKGYGKINHPDKLIFHCYMQQGGSGSPALSHRHADSVCVVGMLTHCEPEAYFFLTDANEKMFNKEYLFEMGPKMSSIFERIRDKIPTEVAKDIFNL